MKFELPVLDINFARAAGACWSEEQFAQHADWRGTALEVLNSNISDSDKIWFITRKDAMPDGLQRLCAVAWARQVQHLMTDERSINTLDVAHRYALGKATSEELAAARAAAGAAAGAASWAAAVAAARAASWDAAAAAARYAAWDAQIIAAIETIEKYTAPQAHKTIQR